MGFDKRSSAISSNSIVEIFFQDGSNDFYCWICHKEGEVICCDVCPRVYHESCMPRVRPLSDNKEFFCPECTKVQDAENTDTRVESMKNVSISGNIYKNSRQSRDRHLGL